MGTEEVDDSILKHIVNDNWHWLFDYLKKDDRSIREISREKNAFYDDIAVLFSAFTEAGIMEGYDAQGTVKYRLLKHGLLPYVFALASPSASNDFEETKLDAALRVCRLAII